MRCQAHIKQVAAVDRRPAMQIQIKRKRSVKARVLCLNVLRATDLTFWGIGIASGLMEDL